MNPLLDVTPEELEFFTEETQIKILPNFTLNSLELISGTIGPLRINVASSVPLWFAKHLKKSKKCRLVLPAELSEDNLSSMIAEERKEIGLQTIDSKIFDIFYAFDQWYAQN